jgi:glycosyltransferase involved in cell wall biosynthesis
MRLSIVIPTRERFEYLRHSLACALSVQQEDVEVVVSDNLSEDQTGQFLDSIKHPRLRVVRPEKRVSMRQNFEFGLKQARGDYVLFHGDDDAVLPGQFGALLALLDQTKPDGLSWRFPVYGWPNAGQSKSLGNFRVLKRHTFGGARSVDLSRLRTALQSGALEDLNYGPGIYHAVMSRDYILGMLARDDGECILSMSPDTYVTMRAIHAGGRFLSVEHPFSMNGFGHRSNGGSNQARANVVNEGTTFRSEAQNDPVKDVLPINKCVAYGYLNVLETLRKNFPQPPMHLELESWYRRVCFEVSRKKAAQERESILADVAYHADTIGDPNALAHAQATPRLLLQRTKIRWAYNKHKLGSFRMDGAQNGSNTVATAVARLDYFLGQDYANVMTGKMSRTEAWLAAQTRRRNLKTYSPKIPEILTHGT